MKIALSTVPCTVFLFSVFFLHFLIGQTQWWFCWCLFCTCLHTAYSITERLTYIFSRYGISGNVDGLKYSSIFLKDASSPLALQTSRA